MRLVDDPDPAWYLDHVVLGASSGRVVERQQQWRDAMRDLRARTAGTPLADAVELACRQGLVLGRAQARDCGLTDAAVRRLVRRGQWTAPRRGVVCPLPADPPDASALPAEQAVSPHGNSVQIAATATALTRRETFITHESATALYGLPLLRVPPVPVLSTTPKLMARRPHATVRSAGFRPDETTDWFGAATTTVARTIIDVARSSGVAAGLAAADAALYDGLVTIDQLATVREWGHHRPGIRSVDRVLELACGQAESPLESLTRLCLADGGLPAPRPQLWIDTAIGPRRLDLAYESERVAVEADGELKYTRGALNREKRRQEAIERAGWEVVRVTWTDIHNDPADVIVRVLRAFARARFRALQVPADHRWRPRVVSQVPKKLNQR